MAMNYTVQLPDILVCLNIRHNKKRTTNFSQVQFTMFETLYIQGRTLNFYSLQMQANEVYDIMQNWRLTYHEYAEILELSQRNSNYVMTFMKNIAFKCSEYIYCLEYDCCKFASYYNTMLGRCSLLPGSIPMENRNMLLANERTIAFTLPKNATTGTIPATPYNNGLIIRFRNSETERFDDGFYHVSGAYHTYITITKLSHIILIQNCNQSENYDIFDCNVKCIDKIGAACDCIPLDNIQDYEITNSTNLCTTLDEVNCFTNAMFDTMIKSYDNISDILSDCRSMCPPSCDRWIYDTYFTFTKLHKGSYERNGADNHNALLTVKFESKMITTLTEHPAYTITNFISNVGGILGVWLSASWLTVVQLIVTLMVFFISILSFLGNMVVLKKKRRQ